LTSKCSIAEPVTVLDTFELLYDEDIIAFESNILIANLTSFPSFQNPWRFDCLFVDEK